MTGGQEALYACKVFRANLSNYICLYILRSKVELLEGIPGKHGGHLRVWP